MNRSNRLRRQPAVAALLLVVVLFVAVVTLVDAIRHDGWGPVVSIGGLPAVMLAVLYPTDTKSCWRRLRARTRT